MATTPPLSPPQLTPPCVVIDFCDDDGRPQTRYFREPRQIITAVSLAEVRPALRVVQQAAEDGYYAAGYIAYEAAPAFDAALHAHATGPLPLLWIGIFDAPSPAPPPPGACEVGEWTASLDAAEYERDIAAIRTAIARGETYQVNHTLRLGAAYEGDPRGFYQRLGAAQQRGAAQRGGYGAFIDIGDHAIASASPELFFKRRGDAIITRPMKGTRPRGRWREEDDTLADELQHSAKDRAENVMIVDLLRNDLGRIAQPGTVRATHLFAIERYSTVLQMTSTVAATQRAGVSLDDIFAALFPCGSVTGAPKISTSRLIAELEATPRGVYCGAIGVVEPGGDATFNVAIRTATFDCVAGRVEYGVGGGITWDSTAAGEYHEAFTKAALLDEAGHDFDLLETLRLENGAYWLLERHLTRLADSADYFERPLDVATIRAALATYATEHAIGVWRVRLTVNSHGTPHITAAPLPAPAADRLRVALAEQPVRCVDRFLYHKTTQRAVYDARKAAHPDCFDVLLQNEDGEITEFTIGNVVVELNGELWTPPRACGLLAGTFRAEMLAADRISECVITRHELKLATRLWLINSVRGWVEVELVE